MSLFGEVCSRPADVAADDASDGDDAVLLRETPEAGFATPAGSMFRSGFGGVRTTRVFTGTATYGGPGVMDVREVRADDPGTTTDPPELGAR